MMVQTVEGKPDRIENRFRSERKADIKIDFIPLKPLTINE